MSGKRIAVLNNLRIGSDKDNQIFYDHFYTHFLSQFVAKFPLDVYTVVVNGNIFASPKLNMKRFQVFDDFMTALEDRGIDHVIFNLSNDDIIKRNNYKDNVISMALAYGNAKYSDMKYSIIDSTEVFIEPFDFQVSPLNKFTYENNDFVDPHFLIMSESNLKNVDFSGKTVISNKYIDGLNKQISEINSTVNTLDMTESDKFGFIILSEDKSYDIIELNYEPISTRIDIIDDRIDNDNPLSWLAKNSKSLRDYSFINVIISGTTTQKLTDKFRNVLDHINGNYKFVSQAEIEEIKVETDVSVGVEKISYLKEMFPDDKANEIIDHIFIEAQK